MPLVQVVGGPIAPSGRTLTTNTRLVVLYMYAHSDASGIYPIRYDASYDISNQRWKPLGTPDGTIFYIPAPENDEMFPRASIHEYQDYSGASPQDFYRSNVAIRQTDLGVWNYADSPEPVIVTNSLVVAWLRLQMPLGA